MPQQVNLKLKGLFTAASDLDGIPDGALDVADDCVIDHDNLVEPRRGFEKLEGDLPLSSDRINRLTTYQSTKILQYGAASLAYYTGAGYATYAGSFAHPDPLLAKVRFVEANQNLYISTATGVKKLDAYNGTPSAAGVPKGLDLQLALAGSSGFFTANEVATPTGNTAIGSPNLTMLSSITGLEVDQYVSGTGIPAGARITSITPSAAVLIDVGSTTAGLTAMTGVVSNSGLVVGQLISATGVPSTARITLITGPTPFTITMSQAAIKTTTLQPVSFLSDPIVSISPALATAAGTVTLTSSSGSQVGYRVLFGIKDANNNLVYGAPTQFATLTNNTGATRNVDVTFTIPAGITTAHFFQIYRSQQTDSAAISPLDDERLVYEGNLSAGDITAGFKTVTDITPDSLTGASLYTGLSQDGILQANEPPPYCKDFCAFRDFVVYANIRSKQRRRLTILAAGVAGGLSVNDVITIAGIAFTAKATENAAAGEFQVFTLGTPAQNITDTVNSLIKVINRYATNTLTYAFLFGGSTDLPGQIIIEERAPGGAAFAVTASANGTAYSPALPTSGTSVSSAQDTFKNGIMVSKPGQPEAVPTVNLLFAGSASSEILRVIPLREYVVILKQGGGIHRLTGTSLATLQVSPFDLTTNLIAPDSAVSLSNEVWGFFDQGICSVSDTGVNVRSRPIEATLKALVASAIATVRTVSFAVGYETDHKYILSLPDSAGDTACTQQYVFNLFTNAFTRWTRTTTAGFIDSTDDKLYLAADRNEMSRERKTNTFRDFVDEAFEVTVFSSSLYTVTLFTVAGITVQDVLYQSDSKSSVIIAIDTLTNTLTLQDLITWSNGSASILPGIAGIVQWKPIVAGNPAFVRQYSEGTVVFKRTRFSSGIVAMYSDVSQSFEDTTLTGSALALWGTFPWGGAPWGGINRPKAIRFLVPQNKQMASQLSVRLSIRAGYSGWACEGMSISFNPVSQEVSS